MSSQATAQVSVLVPDTFRKLSQKLPSHTNHCGACDARGGCLAEQFLAHSGQAYRVMKNSRSLNRGEHIFRESDESVSIYVVKSGSVKSYLITPDGEEQVLGFYMPGDVLGLDGLSELGQMSSAIALESTSVCRVPFSQLSEIALASGFPQLVSEQISRDHNLVLMLARKDADGRLASFLYDLSERFRVKGYSSCEFILTMSRQEIGSYLGLAVETVSRTLSRFQDSGLLNVKRRQVEIHNIEALRMIAGAQTPH